MITVQTMQILLFLIPGFIATKIYDMLIVRPSKDKFHVIIEAMIFSMIVYTIFSLIPGMKPVSLDPAGFSVSYNPLAFLLLLLIAIIIPIVISLFVYHDWPLKLARRINLTKKTARASVWNDTFNEHTTWITIGFADGRRITGWPRFFPDHPEDPCFFLIYPRWVTQVKGEQVMIPLDVEGILITKEMQIEYIYFLKDDLPVAPEAQNKQ